MPVNGREGPFIRAVLARLSREDFIAMNERWKVEGREDDQPCQRVLHSPLPIYRDTLNLELSIQRQVVGRRPHFHVVDSSHPLAQEQQ